MTDRKRTLIFVNILMAVLLLRRLQRYFHLFERSSAQCGHGVGADQRIFTGNRNYDAVERFFNHAFSCPKFVFDRHWIVYRGACGLRHGEEFYSDDDEESSSGMREWNPHIYGSSRFVDDLSH